MGRAQLVQLIEELLFILEFFDDSLGDEVAVSGQLGQVGSKGYPVGGFIGLLGGYQFFFNEEVQ